MKVVRLRVDEQIVDGRYDDLVVIDSRLDMDVIDFNDLTCR